MVSYSGRRLCGGGRNDFSGRDDFGKRVYGEKNRTFDGEMELSVWRGKCGRKKGRKKQIFERKPGNGRMAGPA